MWAWGPFKLKCFSFGSVRISTFSSSFILPWSVSISYWIILRVALEQQCNLVSHFCDWERVCKVDEDSDLVNQLLVQWDNYIDEFGWASKLAYDFANTTESNAFLHVDNVTYNPFFCSKSMNIMLHFILNSSWLSVSWSAITYSNVPLKIIAKILKTRESNVIYR